MLSALDHVVVAVRDLSAATARYTLLLGRPPSRRSEVPRCGWHSTLFRLSKTDLELRSPLETGSSCEVLRARLDREDEGLCALSFRTADAAELVKELRARGVAAPDAQVVESMETPGGVIRHRRTVLLPLELTRSVPVCVVEPDASEAPVSDQADATEPPSVMELSSVTGLDHAVVVSHDASAARRLYGETLGLRLALERDFEARRLHLLFFRVGGVTLEVAVPLGAQAPDLARDRLHGLSWRVGDVEAAHRRLAAAGFELSEVRPGMKPGTKVFTVRGETHGVATLFLGPDPASAAGSERPALR